MVFIGSLDARVGASSLIDIKQMARSCRVKVVACTQESGAARTVYYIARVDFPGEKVRIAEPAGIATAAIRGIGHKRNSPERDLA
jgi:hypothetical protein